MLATPSNRATLYDAQDFWTAGQLQRTPASKYSQAKRKIFLLQEYSPPRNYNGKAEKEKKKVIYDRRKVRQSLVWSLGDRISVSQLRAPIPLTSVWEFSDLQRRDSSFLEPSRENLVRNSRDPAFFNTIPTEKVWIGAKANKTAPTPDMHHHRRRSGHASANTSMTDVRKLAVTADVSSTKHKSSRPAMTRRTTPQTAQKLGRSPRLREKEWEEERFLADERESFPQFW